MNLPTHLQPLHACVYTTITITSVWYLWEGSNGKFCVMCEMQEMDPWKMREGKEGDSEGWGEILCVEDARSKLCLLYTSDAADE